MSTAHAAVTGVQDAGTDVITYTWAVMDSDDDGVAIGVEPGRDYFCQLLGTLGSGGSCTMRGSLDGGTTYGAVKDQGGNACTMTAIGVMFHMYTAAGLVKPVVTAGDGSTALQVVIYARRRPA